jgi:aldehyde:ferredoxin oxidoreductase
MIDPDKLEEQQAKPCSGRYQESPVGKEFLIMGRIQKSGYQGAWVYVDLTSGDIDYLESNTRAERDYLGGRGLQAHLLAERIAQLGGPVQNPLGPENRFVIGCSAVNDTKIHTAGRGSASFFSPLTRSPAPLDPELPPVHGMVTHSSLGGSLPNLLKKAGIDQLIIDGEASSPVRIEVIDGEVRIIEAESDLFEERDGVRYPLRSREMDAALKARISNPRSASLYTGPAGWMKVPYACVTSDQDRNFGRGGAGAVLGAKKLVAITFAGSAATTLHDQELFDRRMKELDEAIEQSIEDDSQTVSFRPTTGTTWWLDRAFNGGYLGDTGGYLPWHNYDEGHFDEEQYAGVSTGSLLEIAAKYKICNRCRKVVCSRLVKTESGELLPRPEFETSALFINCCISDRAALVELNHLCNQLGLDTMSTAAVISAAMDLDEKGVLAELSMSLPFGDAAAMATAIEQIAYRQGPLGRLLGQTADEIARSVMEKLGERHRSDLLWCLTTAYGGLGYAGVEPKAFPAMHACYATSNRGRGDHTYGWTVQAEEQGLANTPDEIARLVADSQAGKAVIDSLGLCDFFPFDTTSEVFLDLLYAVSGNRYSASELVDCGRRTVTLERLLNNIQGRTLPYDAYIPPKLEVPMSRGPMQGRKVDADLHGKILAAYNREQGWSAEGIVEESTLKALGIAPPGALRL